MSKKILCLLMIFSFLPLYAASAASEEYIFSAPDKQSYIFYNVNGDNYMSDFFKFANTDLSRLCGWSEDEDGEGKVFRYATDSASPGGYVSISLKQNIENKSEFKLSYDFRISSMANGVKFVLPTDFPSDSAAFSVSDGKLMQGGSSVLSLDGETWYSAVLEKNGGKKTLTLARRGSEPVFSKTVTDSRGSASSLSFGVSASNTSADVCFDNFKIYSLSAENPDDCIARYYSVFYPRNDDSYSQQSILGTNAVFTADIAFYACGAKRLYSDYSLAPIRRGEKVLVPPAFFAGALSMTYSGGAVDGVDVSECISIENGAEYIDTAAASRLMGLYTYEDERGFTVCGKTECDLSNSMSPFEIKETADNLYRYMYFDRADSGEILSLASRSRPRILTNEENLKNTLSYIETDTTMQNWKANVVSNADALLSKPNVEYVLEGIRLLNATRTVLSRCATLSSAYYITGDSKYAAKCIDEMKNACSWTDWNTSQHYLDSSEMCYGIAIGFDTFYDYISDADKEYIINRTTELSLAVSVSAYEGTFADMGSEWRYASGNWGAVCSGGMTAALISFAGEKWGMCESTREYLLSNAMHSMEYPVMLFYPDGSWSEGTSYWGYTTKYFVGAFMGSLYFSTGDTWGFLRPEGISECLNGIIHLQSESSGTFNYADSDIGFADSPAGFLFAGITDNPDTMASWKNVYSLTVKTGNPYAILWYKPNGGSVSALANDVWLRSAGAGVMREEHANTKAAYVGVRGGQNHTNHDNLDLGSFLFDALGERWAMELGKDDYNIEDGYWALSGYELYVKRPEGQNCFVINPEKGDTVGEYYQQKLDSFAPLTQFVTKPRGAYMVLDLTDANSADVSDYRRGFLFSDMRKSLVVQDELSLISENSTLYWSMHTEAAIAVDSDRKGATLTLGRETLRVTVDTNAELKFYSSGATALPGTVVREGEYNRDHINKLLLKGTGSGDVYITVKLTPQYDYLNLNENAEYIPISDWSIEDGERDGALRIYPLGEDGRINTDSDYEFCAVLPADSGNCELVCGDEVLCSLGEGVKGKNTFVIPKNTVSLIGDRDIRLRADFGNGFEESVDTRVHFYRASERVLTNTIDFENCTLTDDLDVIRSQSTITTIDTKDTSEFSVVKKNGSNQLKYKINHSLTTGTPFIRKTIPTVSCGRVVFEFDFMCDETGDAINFETRSSDRGYANFDGVNGTVSIINRYGTMGQKAVSYVPGTKCHAEIVLDLNSQTYCTRIDGEAVSGGSIAISNLVYMGLNLGSGNARGGSIYIDNIRVGAQCLTDDFLTCHSYDRSVTDDITFENCTATTDTDTIISQSSIEAIADKDVSSFSVTNKEKNMQLCFNTSQAVISGLPYIRKTIPAVSGERVKFEFDFMCDESGDFINFETRSSSKEYANFDGSRGSAVVVDKNAGLGKNGTAYIPGNVCHAEIILDLPAQTYAVSTDGEIVSEGTITISDLVYMGLNFGTVNSGGGSIYIDNIKVSTQERENSKYIVGNHFEPSLASKAYIAYYSDNSLVFTESITSDAACTYFEFEEKNIEYDRIKTFVFTDEIIPTKKSGEYWK